MVMVQTAKKCFVDNKLQEAGSVFDYTGELASYMTVVEEEAAPKPKKKSSTKKKKS